MVFVLVCVLRGCCLSAARLCLGVVCLLCACRVRVVCVFVLFVWLVVV